VSVHEGPITSTSNASGWGPLAVVGVDSVVADEVGRSLVGSLGDVRSVGVETGTPADGVPGEAGDPEGPLPLSDICAATTTKPTTRMATTTQLMTSSNL